MISTALLAWALTQAPSAPAAVLPPSTVALVEAYSDGRVNYELTSAKPAWMWTPLFPRINDWQLPPGSLPVTALRLSRVLVGRNVQVDVSVLLGRSHKEEAPVATVTFAPGAHVVVNRRRLHARGSDTVRTRSVDAWRGGREAVADVHNRSVRPLDRAPGPIATGWCTTARRRSAPARVAADRIRSRGGGGLK
jgi:hypothetical protein